MRCPVCDATYAGAPRFCALDGTPLVSDEEPARAVLPTDLSDALATYIAAPLTAAPPTATPPTAVLPTLAPPIAAGPVALAAPEPSPVISLLPPARSPRRVPLPFVGALAALVVVVALLAVAGRGDEASDTDVGVEDAAVVTETPDDAVVEAEPPGERLLGTPTTWRTARNDLRVGLVDGGVTVREADLALSASTYVNDLDRVWLDGRDVVRFGVDDGTWATTYYWEVGPNLVHYVGRNRATGEVNLSRRPGTAALVQAAEGSVPVRTFRTPSERDAEAALWQAGGSGTLVVVGLFDDPENAKARSEQLAASGLASYVAATDLYTGFEASRTVVSMGPFSRDEAARRLAAVQRVVPDAFTRDVSTP